MLCPFIHCCFLTTSTIRYGRFHVQAQRCMAETISPEKMRLNRWTREENKVYNPARFDRRFVALALLVFAQAFASCLRRRRVVIFVAFG